MTDEHRNDNQNVEQKQEPKKNIFGVEMAPDYEVNLSEKKKKAIKIWLVIGAILTPMLPFTGQAIINFRPSIFLFVTF